LLMETVVLKGHDCRENTSRIASALVDGKVLVLPAATVYGISARYDDPAALKKIYMIKKRREDMAFIILISKIGQLHMLASQISSQGKKLVKKYWECDPPLPLTLVFKKSGMIGAGTTGGRDTVAVRMAGLKAVRDIIDIAGPIVSTSANISGQDIRPVSISDIPLSIRQQADLTVTLEGGLKGKESTIIDVSGSEPALIREGALSFESILRDL